jgi:phosphomannomutase / phosphoglucomutase
MKINPQMFREYDIRGIVDQDLTVESVTLLAQALANYFIENNELTVLIAEDNRPSSIPFAKIMSSVFCDSGLSVIDLGTVTTPIFYFASRLKKVNAGVMITASHNPKEYNGFKVLLGASTIYGQDIQHLLHLCESSSWKPSLNKGVVEFSNVFPIYLQHLQKVIQFGPRKLKVLLDCGNGTASLSSPEILKHFPLQLKEMYCDSDPSFPNHFPDPVKASNMKDAANFVKDNHFDLAIGLDGDGDRLGVVDELGNMIWGDMLMVIYAREILAKHPCETILVEVKCSQLLIDEIERLGGKAVVYKTGHSLIKAKMREIDAIMAGEMSGHLFFNDEYFGFDDATYAALRLLRILSNSDQPLSVLLADLPRLFSTPEIRVHVPEEEKVMFVKQAHAYLSARFEYIDIDGIRAKMHGGWGLVRASNTGPELIIRAEGPDLENLEAIKQEINLALEPLNIPWV